MNLMTDPQGRSDTGAAPRGLGTVQLAPEAGALLRARLGIAPHEAPRITFIAGPGDVVGSFRYWCDGQQDARVPVVTYSVMFYDLMEAFDASAQVLAFQPFQGPPDPRFRFDLTARDPWTTRAEYIASERRYAAQALAHIRDFDPHVVIAGTDYPPAGWRGLARGRRLILTMHNTFWPMGRRDRSPKALFRRARLAWRARAVQDAVCTSDECARQLADLTRGRIRGLVQRPQMLGAYPVKALDRVRDLLFLGRIEANKGIFLLLDVFCRLRRAHPDLRLTFCGSGGAEAELRRRIAETAPDAAQFLGRLSAEDVHRRIGLSDLVVCPTTAGFSEGLAMVGFEAAAHGVPTVMSSVVPAKDLLSGGCEVFPVDDAAALESVLAALIRDPERYRGLAAGLADIRAEMHDPGLSWGSQLGRVLLR